MSNFSGQDTSEVNYPYIGCRTSTPENPGGHFHKDLSPLVSLIDVDYLEKLFQVNPTVQNDTCDFYVSTSSRRRTCGTKPFNDSFKCLIITCFFRDQSCSRAWQSCDCNLRGRIYSHDP